MSAILKKELRSYIRRGSAFFFLAASLFYIGVLTMGYNFYTGYTQIELVLSSLTIAIAFTLPLLVLNLFSRDRGTRTDKLLVALSFRSSDVVFGKYLAALTFLGIDTVILAIFPIIIGMFGEVNYLSAYLSIVCFLLFCMMMLALVTFIASAFKSAVTSLIVSYLSVLFSFLLYLVPTGAGTGVWYTVASVLRFLSPFSHFDSFLSNNFNIASVIYFVLFTALFLSLSVIITKRNEETLKFGKKSNELRRFAVSPILATILCVCVVVVNTVIYFVPEKITMLDVSKNYLGDISDTTKKFIGDLDTDVRIYVINPDGSEKELNKFISLYDKNSDHISVIPTSAYNIAEKLMELGWDGYSEIAPYTIVVESDKGFERTQVANPSSLYYYDNPEFGAMDYDTYSYYYSILSQYAASDATYAEMLESFIYDTSIRTNIEQVLNEYIEYAVIDIIPKPYFLTGHDETNVTLNDAFTYFGFAFTNVDLTQKSIPEDASVLIINAPKSDFSDEETAVLKDFLANGGSMTVITNEANLKMPNLMSLLNAYGVSANPGFVAYNYEAELEAEETTEETAEAELPDKNLIEAPFNASHEVFAALEGYSAVVLRANHIDISSDIPAGVNALPVLTTDAKCYIDGLENSEGQKVVGVAISDERNENSSNIVWITGADAFEGDEVYQMNPYGAIYAILWGLDNYTSTLSAVDAKTVPMSYVSISSGARLALLIVFVFVIPAILIAVGTVLLVRFKKSPFSKKKVSLDPQSTEEIPEIEEASDKTEE